MLHVSLLVSLNQEMGKKSSKLFVAAACIVLTFT
jgi:hypothetical protein